MFSSPWARAWALRRRRPLPLRPPGGGRLRRVKAGLHPFRRFRLARLGAGKTVGQLRRPLQLDPRVGEALLQASRPGDGRRNPEEIANAGGKGVDQRQQGGFQRFLLAGQFRQGGLHRLPLLLRLCRHYAGLP